MSAELMCAMLIGYFMLKPIQRETAKTDMCRITVELGEQWWATNSNKVLGCLAVQDTSQEVKDKVTNLVNAFITWAS